MTAKIEITLENLLDSYDWAEVFADESFGNTDKAVSVAPPDADVSYEPMSRVDVAEIIAAVNGENDSEPWLGVFLLKDGRYLVAEGGCGYSGWDVQGGNSLIVCESMEDVLQFGLTAEDRSRLQLGKPDNGDTNANQA